MERIPVPSGVGAILAIIVLVVVVVLMVVGQLDYHVGGLLAALAIARLC